jgi:hypothetical protein
MLKRGLFCDLFEEAGEGTGGGGGGGGAPAATSLKDSVLQAFAEAEKASGAAPVTEGETGEGSGTGESTGEGGESTKGTGETDREGEATGKEDEVVEFDASPEEIRAGLSILRSLGNPETAAETIQELAKVGGYDLTKKSDVKALEKDAKSILKEKLGASYDIIGGDALAEAFQAIIDNEVGKQTKPVMDKLNVAEMQANQSKADAAMDAMWSRHNVTDTKLREKVAGVMLSKMKVMPATPNADINTYLDDMYALATRDTERARTVKSVVKKIETNANDVSRTSGEGSGIDESRVRQGSKLPSISEAVKAAFAGKKLD